MLEVVTIGVIMTGVRTLLLLALVGLSGIHSASTTSDSGCGQNPADIVFLLDSSGSVGSTNFKKQLDFVKQFANSFDIGPNAVQIGVTTFATTPINRFWMNQHPTKADLVRAIDAIPYTSGGTHTDSGLNFVYNQAFTNPHGDRDTVANILIVMTDGRSQTHTQTIAAANNIKKTTNWSVFSIGIGHSVSRPELEAIATDPKNVFTVQNFDALHSIQATLKKTACESHGGTCKDALINCAQYTQASCHDPYLNWAITNCPNYCNLCDRVGTVPHVTQPSFTSGGGNTVIHFTGCYYKGRVYRTGDAWSDGCEHHCTCINGHTGYYQCSARCQTYTNIPQGCILQKDPGACCETLHCSGTGNQTGTGIQIGTGSGCFYKGQTYGEDQTWNDGCMLSCTCEDAASSRYQCRQRCITWTLPAACTIHDPAPGKCCKTPSCPAGYTISYPPGYKEE